MTHLAGCGFPTADFADPVAAVSGELALSIFAAPSHLRMPVALAAARQGLWLHVDIMRDRDGRDIGVELACARELTAGGQHSVDVHLIGDGAAAAFEDVCALRSKRITMAFECCTDVAGMAAAVRESGGQPWLAVAPATSVDDVATFVPAVDGVLIMLLTPGTCDPADLSLLSKAETLAPLLPVGVDGSVDSGNVQQCLDAGVRYIVSGRGLLRSAFGVRDLSPNYAKGIL